MDLVKRVGKILCYGVFLWVFGGVWILYGIDLFPALLVCLLFRESVPCVAMTGILCGALAAGRQEADAFLALYWVAAAFGFGWIAARLRPGVWRAVGLALVLSLGGEWYRHLLGGLFGGSAGAALRLQCAAVAAVTPPVWWLCGRWGADRERSYL